MKKSIFCLLLCLLAFRSYTQTGSINGMVSDAKTGETLPFCNVFISNTTLATTTDSEGKFTLEGLPLGKYEIGFSFIGYQAIQKPVTINSGSNLVLNVQLVSQDQTLSDVEIKSSRDRNWERELRKFKNYFLGNDQMAAECEILNPWVIDFPEQNTGNNFTAMANQPIEIKNEALGYLLTFNLKEFIFTNQYSRISGAVRFSELESSNPNVEAKWAKNRLNTYLKSPANMFRAMILGRHEQEGFYLYGNKPGGSATQNMRTDIFANELGKSVISYNPENLVRPGQKSGEYEIEMKGRIEIHYQKGYSQVNTYKDAPYPISWLEVRGNMVKVNQNGMVLNQNDLVFSGDMDKSKVATLLPLDYNPPLTDISNTLLVRDANSLQEKVYLHTDRSYYYQGDQVFFKAYLNYANPAFKNELSRILYVELISAERDIVFQKKYKIENGTAIGDFYLPDSLGQKEYYLRSYTNWNRNYGPDSYFVKVLPVLNIYDRLAAAEETLSISSQNNILITSPKESYGKRESVKLNITVQDSTGQALAANLSISVRDTYFDKGISDNSNILNSLQIEEVPSHITTEKFSYPVQRQFDLPGRFLNDRGKPSATAFTAYINNFEGELELETDKEGNFLLEEMDFYGPVEFTFIALDKKGKNYGSFEVNPALNPPFFVPADLNMPKITRSNEPLFITDKENFPLESQTLEEITVPGETIPMERNAIYGKPDYLVKGESLTRGGNTNDLLLSLKGFVPGMSVTSTGGEGRQQIRLRGGSSSASLSMEPLVMIDGAVLPSGPGGNASDHIRSINPNDVERIEIVSRISSMMGDVGRNGIIAIYLKKGGNHQNNFALSTSQGLSRFTVEGYSFANIFYHLNYSEEENPPINDQRATLYWNPYLITDSNTGKLEIDFFTNDLNSSKYVIIEGMSITGIPIWGTYLIRSED